MRQYDTVGGALAARAKLNAKLEAANAAVKAVEAERNELDDQLADLLKATGQDRATAAGLVASWDTKFITTVVDWDLFRPYVARTHNWQLLYRRVNLKACEELLETRRGRKPLPGTKFAEVTKLKITKATK